MSQKKPTTNEQLAELRELIQGRQPSQVVSVDRELQEMNNTLQRLLYAATAKYGIHMQQENNVIATAQIPIMQPPSSHRLQWEVAKDGLSIMLYIVLTDSPEETSGNGSSHSTESPQEGQGVNSDSSVATPPGAEEGEGEVDAATSTKPSPSALGEGPGDEFEDEIVVGLDDERDDGVNPYGN